MMKKNNSFFFILFILSPVITQAVMIPMRDYIQLRTGMTEAEVLYRIGQFDYETVRSDYYHNIIEKVWYYIPKRHSSDAWITEIVLNRSGKIQSMERYRARR